MTEKLDLEELEQAFIRFFRRNVVGIYDSEQREMWPEFLGVVSADYETLRNAAPSLFERVREAGRYIESLTKKYADEAKENESLRARITELERQAKEDEAAMQGAVTLWESDEFIGQGIQELRKPLVKRIRERLAARSKA